MKMHKKTHPVVRVLSLLIPVALIALFVVLRDIAGFRVGSDTDFGAVYKMRCNNETFYHWYIFKEDGTVWEENLTDEEPYIWQDGSRISLVLQSHDIQDIEDFEEDICFQDASFRNYYLDEGKVTTQIVDVPEISKKLELKSCKNKKIQSDSKYVKLSEITLPDIQDSLYSWAVCDAWGEELWSDFSTVQPEIIQDSDKIMLFYQDLEENQESVRIFYPQESYFSYDYHTDENRKIFIEHAFDGFYFYGIRYDSQIAQTENFVNQTESEKICFIDDAYFRAKNEVTIPYSLVQFRADFTITDSQNVVFNYWEVTFSQMDNPNGETQTIYLNGDGKTVLILNGKPNIA